MARKMPFRPRSNTKQISQSYSDGVVQIYDIVDTAPPGYKPQPQKELFLTLRYDERKLGVSRYYAAMQNQIEIKRVLRVPRVPGICNQQIAVTEDGWMYSISLVQLAADVYPPSVDITLVDIEQSLAMIAEGGVEDEQNRDSDLG